MKMSEEEILDIMKLAGEDLYEKYKKTDDKNPDDTKPELWSGIVNLIAL